MGFFSSVGKFLGGGSEGSSAGTSGFKLLPPEIQDYYKDFATDAASYTLPSTANLDMYTPLDITDDEQSALSLIRDGLSPTAESLQSDIDMFMNPFDDYVIDAINRESQGDYSVLKSALSNAGQFGSNRDILGANDIDLTRLNQIGSFKQDQYNKAIDYTLNDLAGLRQQDIQNLLGAGEFERNIDLQNKQVPLAALDTAAKYLGILPESGGSQQVSKQSSTGGLSSFF